MPKFYFTFGQVHVHSICGKTLDKDCVAVLEASDYDIARNMAFRMFNDKFHDQYSESDWDESLLEYFPRGYVYI